MRLLVAQGGLTVTPAAKAAGAVDKIKAAGLWSAMF
jgi:hypothetical protein